MTQAQRKTIDDVRAFWDGNPLWTGETRFAPGTKEFYEEHRRVYRDDAFVGELDRRFFPEQDRQAPILDLGCGIGIWPVEFWERGYRNITAADISPNSIALAKKRAETYGVTARFQVENAESLSFPDHAFQHVNCQGVVHHTPSPDRAVAEIFRVLKPGGTASISVYYRNIVIRRWDMFRPLSKLLFRWGARLSGRGREDIFNLPATEDIVRMYDGKDNPIGLSYNRAGFGALLDKGFVIEDIYFHFFPARALPFRVPRWLHKILDRRLPFMIFATVRKP